MIVGAYRGNADKVMMDAAKIVERLRHTSVTIGELKAEYHCAFTTLYKAIFSKVPKEEYRRLAYQRTIRGNKATRFKKGQRAWNKRLKGIHLSPASEFKKGHLPANHKPKGSLVIRKDSIGNSYRYIKISGLKDGRHKWIPYAHYLWQQENGPIPAGMIIAHKNGKSLDDRIENLVLTNRAGNIALMRRNNPQARKKAIRNYKKTRRRQRLERERQKLYELKTRLEREKELKELKELAEELRQREAAESIKAKMIGRIISWYECKGCGYETDHPDPPCPKCGGIAFERIEQPARFAQQKAELELLSRTGT